MRPGKRWAHSLIEILIASGLLIILLGAVVTALVACNNYLRNAETKIEAQTQALAASVWISRSLSESSINATCASVAPPAFGVSFPSPRDPSSGDVNWSTSEGGALVWRQVKFCFLEPGTNRIVVRGFPLYYAGTTASVMWSGFPPYPANGVVDLTMGPQPLTAAIATNTSAPDRVVARNIRVFTVDVFPATDPVASRASTANVVVESYAPYYGLNYGIRVITGVRLQN